MTEDPTARDIKECRECGATQPIGEFYRSSSTRGARRNTCRTCVSAYNKRWYDKHRAAEGKRNDYAREQKLRQRYGLTSDAWDELLASQGHRCAICDTTEAGGYYNTWHVDHDHACCDSKRSCGRCIRGLLCFDCNMLLACVRDDRERLIRAAAYLGSPPAPVVLKEPARPVGRLRQTHCRNGHEFTPENTITTIRGEHRCRLCTNAKKRATRALQARSRCTKQ